MKHVIIGAGPAGVIAAETLRKVQPKSSIILIGDEHEPPYSRMALPYYLIENINEAGTYLRKSDSHFADSDIEIIRDRVSRVDTSAKHVTLENGGPLNYDKLLIATGSYPVRPPIPGMDLPNIYSCWTLEDGRNIAAKAKKSKGRHLCRLQGLHSSLPFWNGEL